MEDKFLEQLTRIADSLEIIAVNIKEQRDDEKEEREMSILDNLQYLYSIELPPDAPPSKHLELKSTIERALKRLDKYK